MTDLSNKRANWIRIEFWAITTIFAFAIFRFIVEGLDNETAPYLDTHNKRYFDEVNMLF